MAIAVVEVFVSVHGVLKFYF